MGEQTLSGTVEHPGAIAEALKADETVSSGGFHSADGTAAFRPGTALSAHLQARVG